MSAEKKRRKKSIGTRILMNSFILTAVICIGSILLAVNNYKDTIINLYSENGYNVGNIILDNIDGDAVMRYATTWEEDEYYHEMCSFLTGVEQASGAAFIYIAVPDRDGNLHYIHDEDSPYLGFVEPMAADVNEVNLVYETGKLSESKFARHSRTYGYLTSSILPIRDSAGRIAALLFVDTSMDTIADSILGYVKLIARNTIIVFVIGSLAYLAYIKLYMIKPIELLTANADDFVRSGAVSNGELERIHTGDEIEELARAISKMEVDIRAYINNIARVTAEKERIGAELNVATKIQSDMLPKVFPHFTDRDDVKIAASMTPAKEVGGDFYDFFFVDDDHLALVMADVSGKGVPAALFMVIAKTLIKNRTLKGDTLSPAQILNDVNNLLCEGNEEGLFVTVWIAIIDLRTGHGIAANAGHEHPALCRGDGEFGLVVYKHSMAVAVMEGIPYREHEFELAPGDTLFVYTDGVAEATNASNELFGTDRMLAALNAGNDADPEALLECVIDAIGEFVQDADQFDDITMLAVRYNGR